MPATLIDQERIFFSLESGERATVSECQVVQMGGCVDGLVNLWMMIKKVIRFSHFKICKAFRQNLICAPSPQKVQQFFISI